MLAEQAPRPARRYPLEAGKPATDYSRVIAGEPVLLIREVRPHVWKVRRLTVAMSDQGAPVVLDDVAAGFLQAGPGLE